MDHRGNRKRSTINDIALDMRNVLLINPWIYDFAAYDMWAEPLGLLYIGGLLREKGYRISLINCFDRHHPDLLKMQNRKSPKDNGFGCGKFHKEVVEKPDILRNVPRKYGRYGLPVEIFRNEMSKIECPDVILVTSSMTYWYPGVFAVIREAREFFPDVPIILGGTYATLCYKHAVQKSGADYVVEGEGEIKALQLVNHLTGGSSQRSDLPVNLDDYPYPAHDLLTSKKSLAILTSRGCPMGCTYCASKLIAGEFRQRDPVKVADELEYYIKSFGTKDFAFYDDALLLNPERHIYVILDEVQSRDLKCRFHTPNGMHASQISKKLARMMYQAGFKTIRIGFETSSEARQKSMGDKINAEGLREAIENLKSAGFMGKEIGVYVLVGLPGQPLDEMIASIRYVHSCGALTKLATYSPIPGTEEWRKAVDRFGFDPDADPILHNNSIYPTRSFGITIEDIQRVKDFTISYNNALQIQKGKRIENC